MACKRKPVGGHYRILADNQHIIYVTAASLEAAQTIADSISAEIRLARQRYEEWLKAEAMTKPQ